MKKIIIWILVLISISVLLIRFSGKVAEVVLKVKQKSGISILSTPDGATIYLDNIEVGKTPYEAKDLDPKEINVKIEKDQAVWQGHVKLTPTTLAIINRDLARDQASSSGEVLTLERGRGIIVISNPSESEIEVDGKVYGKAPITINVESGEHTLIVSHPNYLKRSIRVYLPTNFKLIVSLDLAISEADLTAIQTPIITTTPLIVVKETPTGFLRVRDKPSLAGKEITQLKVGDKLILLEELNSWDRVRLSEGAEGYVSSAYVEKVLSP